MNNDFRSAQLAAKTVGDYFLLKNWTEPRSIEISEVGELRDSLTIIDYYLQKKRREIEAKLLGEPHQYQYQIRDGDMGRYVSRDGGGLDHHVPPGQADGQLVEIPVHAQSRIEPDCMLLCD